MPIDCRVPSADAPTDGRCSSLHQRQRQGKALVGAASRRQVGIGREGSRGAVAREMPGSGCVTPTSVGWRPGGMRPAIIRTLSAAGGGGAAAQAGRAQSSCSRVEMRAAGGWLLQRRRAGEELAATGDKRLFFCPARDDLEHRLLPESKAAKVVVVALSRS
jgi:hypothetical protein